MFKLLCWRWVGIVLVLAVFVGVVLAHLTGAVQAQRGLEESARQLHETMGY